MVIGLGTRLHVHVTTLCCQFAAISLVYQAVWVENKAMLLYPSPSTLRWREETEGGGGGDK